MSNLDISILLFGVVVLGAALVQVLSQRKPWVQFLLGISGSYLMVGCLVHFIPELIDEYGSINGLYVMLGFLIQLGLEHFSHGIEHGHVHGAKSIKPLVMLVALGVHAWIEAIPLALQATDHAEVHHHSGAMLTSGIALHKFTVGIALASFFAKYWGMGKRSWMWIVVFAAIAPIGIFTGEALIHSGVLGSDMAGILYGLLIGMVLQISTTIIFESGHGHQWTWKRALPLLIGAALALVLNQH